MVEQQLGLELFEGRQQLVEELLVSALQLEPFV
jgi:hypothetical protein